MKIKLKIKEKLLTFYSNRLLKKRIGGKVGMGFDKAKSFGIICKYQNVKSYKVIVKFAAELRRLGKKVDGICLLEHTDTNYDYSFSSFNYDDITFSGKIIDKEINSFINKRFDYLYFVNFEINPILGYLLSKSKAKCKIGYFIKEDTRYLDMMVNFKKEDQIKDIINLTEQMLIYTKMLKS